MIRTILTVTALLASNAPLLAGVYDNPTPPNASAINAANGAFQPLEPRADTTREGMIRTTGNGGGQ